MDAARSNTLKKEQAANSLKNSDNSNSQKLKMPGRFKQRKGVAES